MPTVTRQRSPWDDYRRRRRWFLLVFLTYMPGMWVIATGLGFVLPRETVFAWVLLAWCGWVLAFLVTYLHWGQFPCPACKKLFFIRNSHLLDYSRGKGGYFGRRCQHCGHPKWATVEDRPVDVPC